MQQPHIEKGSLMLFYVFTHLTEQWLLLTKRQRLIVKSQFLLITQEILTRWTAIVREALAEIGDLQILAEDEAIRAGIQNYDIIIIDAGTVPDEVALISRLMAKNPQARIVIATASPTWTRARDALKAGAVDYILKSINGNELRAKIQSIMQMHQLSRLTRS